MSFLLLALQGCGDDNGFQPDTVRFGQVGEVRITLVIPLLSNQDGELQQTVTWNSSGAWQIRESIAYRGLLGDEQVRQNSEPTGTFAASYATFITQLNDYEGLKLFTDLLPRDLDPVCDLGDTRLTLVIWDELKEESATWHRCAEGTLGTLDIASAGPDDGAVRLVQAAILARDRTVGRNSTYTYQGSVPFGTLDRSEDSGARLAAPEYFLSRAPGVLETPEGWVDFWRAHKENPAAQPPVVDWANEMVLVAADGRRTEAGDSLEFRRILQTAQGTQVTLFERIPGNFCSPAAREHYPVHIIVAPRTPLPFDFRPIEEERVPCGS